MTDDVDDFGERSAPRARQGASPYSTGGGGVTFERRVAVMHLARLLTGATASELKGRRVVKVAFQQAPAMPVDDLVISASTDDESVPDLELAVAVRRSPGFVASEDATEKLIGSFLRAAEHDSSLEVVRRLVVCVAGPQNATSQVGELAAIAASQPFEAFFPLIREPGKFRRAVVERLEQLSRLVGANLDETAPAEVVETATWDLLNRLDVLMPRVESPDEADWAELLNLLEPWAREQTPAGAAALRDRLESLAAEYAPRAAVVDVGMLRRATNDALNVERRRRTRGWAELLRLDEDARGSVRSTTGVGDEAVHLERKEASAALMRDADDVPCLLVTGESGVGKSALVRDLLVGAMRGAPNDVQVVILNLRLLPRLPIELRAKLGVPLAELLFEMSAPRRVLVIDSAEYAVESGSELLRQLLESARKAEVSAWVLSTTDGLAAVRSTVEATFESFSEHEVGVLDDAEIEEIGKGLPQLGVLLTDRGRANYCGGPSLEICWRELSRRISCSVRVTFLVSFGRG